MLAVLPGYLITGTSVYICIDKGAPPPTITICDSGYIWIRRFDSEALYKVVYETDYWKAKIAPRVPDCLDREKDIIQRILSPSHSTVQ